MAESEATQRQRLDPVIKDAQLDVLGKVQNGEPLDWLERNVVSSMLGNRLGMCEEVKQLVREMRASGKLQTALPVGYDFWMK